MIEEKKLSPHSLDNFTFSEDEDTSFDMVPNVPLPDEEPRTPDLSHLPREVLRSGTVEALISQNEDLMARLKVNIRRMSLLEQEVESGRLENSSLKNSLGALRDEILVFREKDQVRFDEERALSDRIDELKKNLAYAERSYGELAENARSLDSQQKIELKQLRHNLQRFLRYRARIHRLIKPSLGSIRELRLDSERKRNLIEGLREQIGKVSRNAALQADSFEELKLQLIEAHDRERTRLVQELEGAKHYEAEATRGRDKITTLQDTQVQLQNELVRTQRSKISLGEKLSEQIRNLQLHLQESKKIQSELEFIKTDLTSENESLSLHNLQIQRELDVTRDQLEQARLMWEKKTGELEKIKGSNQSLERMNSELSSQSKTCREFTKQALAEIERVQQSMAEPEQTQFQAESQKQSIKVLAELLSQLSENL